MAEPKLVGAAPSRVARGRPRDLRLLQDAPGLVEERGSRRGQGHAALRAVEEPHAKLLLELAHLLADGRLRDVQALCRAAEVQLLRDGNEVSEVSEFHGGHSAVLGQRRLDSRTGVVISC
jgi:hypothetical protein